MFCSVGRAALGRSLHSGSQAVGETPARYKTHPNTQCFLLQMSGELVNLVISHRNTDYLAPLNINPLSTQRGETKPVNGQQVRGE